MNFFTKRRNKNIFFNCRHDFVDICEYYEIYKKSELHIFKLNLIKIRIIH